MENVALNQFIAGAITLGHLVGGMYFLRFWKRSQDRLFLFFGLAFFVFSAQRIALLLAGQTDERASVFLYGLRLVGFLLILIAIADKNRASKAASTSSASSPASRPEREPQVK